VQPEQYIVPEVHFPENRVEILYNLKCSSQAKMEYIRAQRDALFLATGLYPAFAESDYWFWSKGFHEEVVAGYEKYDSDYGCPDVSNVRW